MLNLTSSGFVIDWSERGGGRGIHTKLIFSNRLGLSYLTLVNKFQIVLALSIECYRIFTSRNFTSWLTILLLAEYPNTFHFFAATEPTSRPQPTSASQPAIVTFPTEKGWQPAGGEDV